MVIMSAEPRNIVKNGPKVRNEGEDTVRTRSVDSLPSACLLSSHFRDVSCAFLLAATAADLSFFFALQHKAPALATDSLLLLKF
jgi:hypothetical protein